MIFQERDKLIMTLLTSGKTVTEVSKELKIQRNNLHMRIAKLIEGGYLRRVSRYEVTKSGEEKLN